MPSYNMSLTHKESILDKPEAHLWQSNMNAPNHPLPSPLGPVFASDTNKMKPKIETAFHDAPRSHHTPL